MPADLVIRNGYLVGGLGGEPTVGNWADINIFDADTVAEGYPYQVHDFPGGAPRLTQPSIGYKATLVNGQVNVVDG